MPRFLMGDSVWTKIKPKDYVDTVFPPQTGKRKSISRDFSRQSLPPGKRISKSGKVYYENRKNRSDIPGKRL